MEMGNDIFNNLQSGTPYYSASKGKPYVFKIVSISPV